MVAAFAMAAKGSLLRISAQKAHQEDMLCFLSGLFGDDAGAPSKPE